MCTRGTSELLLRVPRLRLPCAKGLALKAGPGLALLGWRGAFSLDTLAFVFSPLVPRRDVV